MRLGELHIPGPPVLHYTLDPIYRALLDGKVIASMEAIEDIRTRLVRKSPREGFRIQVDARPSAAPLPVVDAL